MTEAGMCRPKRAEWKKIQ